MPMRHSDVLLAIQGEGEEHQRRLLGRHEEV
jgi:hypothetical protein